MDKSVIVINAACRASAEVEMIKTNLGYLQSEISDEAHNYIVSMLDETLKQLKVIKDNAL